ncbi:unnamed protein product [Camellia sinensis]
MHKVEHPVTEWIAEINLPAAQVAVGMRIPLWQIPESTRPKGHCELSFKSKPNVWAYFSVKSGGGIHEFSDSQFEGSFVIKVKGPEGWSWDPDQVPVVVDQAGCNANEDINFRFTGFTVSGRVVGSVGGESCSNKNGGPSNVNVELLSPTGDLVTSVLVSPTGSYSFTNIIPGKYKLRASRPDFNVEVRGFAEVELGFENGLVDDIFFVPGYDILGSVVAQGDPILGVHIYLYSNDISRVDCALGSGNAPRQRKALCHAVSDAEGMFTFKSIPCVLKMNQSEIEAEIHTLRDGGLLMQEEAARTGLLIDGRTCLLQNFTGLLLLLQCCGEAGCY